MIAFKEIGRLPAAGDNCAVATRTLAAGTEIEKEGRRFILSHTTLMGHRFAVRAIPTGAPLLSWGMTFGRALQDIAPGEYVCNAGLLEELSGRPLDFDLAEAPNFVDARDPYHFDAARFRPAPALPHAASAHTFMGLSRPGKRGVGTRNMVVLLGTNALVNGFVQQLAKEVHALAADYAHVDGIVAVTHSEGSRAGGNNEEMALRTLAGFLVHANVGGVLAVDAGESGLSNARLRAYAAAHGYPLDDVAHLFISLRGPYAVDMLLAKKMVGCLLPQADKARRSRHPLSELKIALQCGGSDAFSGISGNPLAALVSKELIQAGGSAVLAETDELIGAEAYLLDKVRDAATVERFLAARERFEERAARHGHSAHGNPTGGNKYRGLYNIYLKSLGAAAKRHADVRLDYVIDYAERLGAPGYYFMDSPGNDLESIAGQVASGCNLIYFVTGNGSITNFPFVPAIKIVTTSERYALLPQEMDINAGAYLEGASLADLAQAARDLSLAVASGAPCAGEKAGHAQVQIWRDWPIAAGRERQTQPRPSGKPLSVQAPQQTAEFTFSGWKSGEAAERPGGGVTSDRVGLIVPASLCSAEIARLAAQHLNEIGLGREKGISRFAALVHTEGCGGSIEPEYVDTIVGYLAHPLAATSLVLEHGCEISHNDFWRRRLREAGIDAGEIGWASVQRDGGIARALARIEAWFTAGCARLAEAEEQTAGLADVRLGLMAEGAVDAQTGAVLAALVQQIAAAGGTVVLPSGDALVMSDSFEQLMPTRSSHSPTLPFAGRAAQPGLHLMANPTGQWSETMSGLGATGVDVILALIGAQPQQGHPFIPVLQATPATGRPLPLRADMDILFSGDPQQQLRQIMAHLSAVLSRKRTPKLRQKNNISFQITRGQLGVSL